MNEGRRASGAGGRAGGLALLVGVAVLALLPRLGPALAGWRWSPDGAEYVLLARSLARGEGFLLPVKVRYHAPGPALHPGWDERAPAWPWLLAGWGRALGDAAPGWPDPRWQLPGVALCALAAAQAAGLARALARRQGLGPRGALASGLLAGLTVAWAPALVRASLHTWAEPLGVVLALGASRLLLAVEAASPGPARSGLALALGLVAGLARLARPEQAVLALALPAWCLARRPLRGALGPLLLGLVLVNAAALAGSGTLAPQTFLLRVADHAQLMRPEPDLSPPGAGVALAGVLRNAGHLLRHLLTPRYAWATLPLALLALGRPAARGTLLLGGALLLAPALAWSTDDPHRFSLAPLALLAAPAAVETERRRRQLLGRRTWPRAAWLAAAALLLGHQAGAWLGRPVAPPPACAPAPGEPVLDDPWSYALVTGRPARLRRPPD